MVLLDSIDECRAGIGYRCNGYAVNGVDGITLVEMQIVKSVGGISVLVVPIS